MTFCKGESRHCILIHSVVVQQLLQYYTPHSTLQEYCIWINPWFQKLNRLFFRNVYSSTTMFIFITHVTEFIINLMKIHENTCRFNDHTRWNLWSIVQKIGFFLKWLIVTQFYEINLKTIKRNYEITNEPWIIYSSAHTSTNVFSSSVMTQWYLNFCCAVQFWTRAIDSQFFIFALFSIWCMVLGQESTISADWFDQWQ